jgi:hypothetical protein
LFVGGGAAYEIARWRSGGGGSIKDANVFERSTAIDLLVRARYWHEDISLVSRTRAIARSGDVDWVDPPVGLRVRHQLASGQDLVLRADVGGFDAGSQFSWNVLGAHNFTFADRNGVTCAGLLGYRALSVGCEKAPASTDTNTMWCSMGQS